MKLRLEAENDGFDLRFGDRLEGRGADAGHKPPDRDGKDQRQDADEEKDWHHHQQHQAVKTALGREDVFAVDDLGIQTAMKKLYKLDDSNKKDFREKLLKISKKWSPYRTYACLHLWNWKDAAPVKNATSS